MNPPTLARPTRNADERLDAVEAKLDEISEQLRVLVDAQRPMLELRAEAGAIVTDVMRTSVDQLAFMEERGYFAFLRELKYLVDRMVEDYDPADLHELADNAANILDTVRGLTQPSVMEVARAAAEAINDGGRREPVGMIGFVRAVGRDKNVQRGLAFGLDLLGRVGRAVSRAPRLTRKQLAPVAQSPEHRPVARATKQAAAAPAAAPAPVAAAIADDGRFVPDGEWDRSVATATATELGLVELTDAHFALVELVRAEYVQSGATPNIRKITTISGKPTREVYSLFPKAPGKTIARIAGVPKPVGCL